MYRVCIAFGHPTRTRNEELVNLIDQEVGIYVGEMEEDLVEAYEEMEVPTFNGAEFTQETSPLFPNKVWRFDDPDEDNCFTYIIVEGETYRRSVRLGKAEAARRITEMYMNME